MLSVCMIVKNEAALLGRCLASIQPAADEIVIVDTGSTDATVEVARQFHARIIESEWRDDFSYSRNISIEHATGRWILWLDADDIVPDTSIIPLNELKQKPADRIYSFVVRNERPGNTGSEFRQARMFPNLPELRFERSIHEQITPSALRMGMPLERCDIVIEHHGYADPQLLRKKAGRNIKLLLQEYPRIAPDPVMAAEIADAYWLIEAGEDAAKWYYEVIALTDENPALSVMASHAYYGLGNISNKNKKFSEAIHFLEQARRRAPWRADVLYSLAVAYEFAGQNDGAVSALYEITAMEPIAEQVGIDFRSAKIKAYLRLIRIFTDKKQVVEAKKAISEAVVAVGGRPEIHNSAGKFFLKNDMPLDALHSFEQSLNLRRDGNIEAFIGLCLIYRKVHREDLIKATLNAIAAEFTENYRYTVARTVLLGESYSTSMGEVEYKKSYTILQQDFFGMI